jgi:hypothetical protein
MFKGLRADFAPAATLPDSVMYREKTSLPRPISYRGAGGTS